ncbi:MAG: Lrp/AsnC family transcriptional regulator [Candidatus Bathyarchaeota archaeon]|nr:Lrp/AsnC family transcriptional regulator [Candidatus Bathyarchaeota archaeon]
MPRNSKKTKTNKLLNELLKDSSRSDRTLAKTVGVSQPTVSRTKKSLQKEGIINGFTVIPNFYKIGYELMALTFVKIKTNLASVEEREKGHQSTKEWMSKQPNVIFCTYCRGLDADAFMVSLHKNYKDFDQFIQKHNQERGHLLTDVKSTLINMDDSQMIKPFTFRSLAEKMCEK